MIRHIIKANNAAEIQAALTAGTLASPYIAMDVSANTTNLVYPAGSQPGEVVQDEDRSSVPVSMYGAIMRTYKGMHGWLQTQLSFPLIFSNKGDYTPRVIVVRKSNYDNGLSQVQEGTTEADYMASLFLNNGEEGPVHPEYWWFAETLYGGDYPWGEPVTWISTKNWWGGSTYIPVPVTPSDNEDDDTYLILAAFCGLDGHATSGNAFVIGSYKVTPGMTNSSAVVWEGIQEYAIDAPTVTDPDSGEELGRGFSARVPANTLYDSIKYTSYFEDEETPAEALQNGTDVRDASIGVNQEFNVQDNNVLSWHNTSENTKTACVAIQLYHSVTGATLPVKGYAVFYCDPES